MNLTTNNEDEAEAGQRSFNAKFADDDEDDEFSPVMMPWSMQSVSVITWNWPAACLFCNSPESVRDLLGSDCP